MPSEEEKIIKMIAEELQKGRSPDMVVKELVDAGMPREEAQKVVGAVQQRIQGGGGRGRAPQRRPPGGGHSWLVPTLMIIAVIVLLWVAFF